MTKNFFNILSDILLKKSKCTMHLEPGFNTDFSSFMLIRYLSMKPNLTQYAVILNNYQYNCLTPEQIYKWCYENIPKQKSGFIRYISKNKKKGKKSK